MNSILWTHKEAFLELGRIEAARVAILGMLAIMAYRINVDHICFVQ
jgi:hypothetical protein